MLVLKKELVVNTLTVNITSIKFIIKDLCRMIFCLEKVLFKAKLPAYLNQKLERAGKMVALEASLINASIKFWGI